MTLLAVLISGNGTNCQALIKASQNGQLSATIAVVISNNAAAPGLRWARDAGIDTVVIDHRDYDRREYFENAMISCLENYGADFVVLAGFMRKLTPLFVNHFCNRIVNIHPSLLPKYRGLDTHRRVIESGDNEHGCTVHFVSDELDAGAVIAVAKLEVSSCDTPETLKQRVHVLEYDLYWRALELVCSKSVFFIDNTLYFGEEPIPYAGLSLPLSV